MIPVRTLTAFDYGLGIWMMSVSVICRSPIGGGLKFLQVESSAEDGIGFPILIDLLMRKIADEGVSDFDFFPLEIPLGVRYAENVMVQLPISPLCHQPLP